MGSSVRIWAALAPNWRSSNTEACEQPKALYTETDGYCVLRYGIRLAKIHEKLIWKDLMELLKDEFLRIIPYEHNSNFPTMWLADNKDKGVSARCVEPIWTDVC